jgi:hypothetical protein
VSLTISGEEDDPRKKVIATGPYRSQQNWTKLDKYESVKPFERPIKIGAAWFNSPSSPKVNLEANNNISARR